MGGLITGITDAIGLTDSKAGDRAYKEQARATEKANALQKKMYEEGKERMAPWMEAGQEGFSKLADLVNAYQTFNQGPAESTRNNLSAFRSDPNLRFSMSDFKKDPGYEFRLKEGQKAIENAAAAKGGMGSGATYKALARFGQNLASNEYNNAFNRFNQEYGRMNQDNLNSYNRFNQDQNNRFNRLNTLANYGQNANSILSGQGTSMANNLSTNYLNLGNAAASNELNRGNTMKDLWKMGATAYMMCWVARAIFGADNPKWLQARDYVLNIGPKWFKNLYAKHGEKFAEFIQDKPLLKKAIKPLFEYFAWRSRISKRVSLEAVCL
jgi:hypothetical protein